MSGLCAASSICVYESRNIGFPLIDDNGDSQAFNIRYNAKIDRCRYRDTGRPQREQREDAKEQCNSPYLGRPHVITRFAPEFAKIEDVPYDFQTRESHQRYHVLRDYRWIEMPHRKRSAQIEDRVGDAVQPA